MQKHELALSSNSDPEQHFMLLELLGEGNFGLVYKAYHKLSGNIVAIKVVPISSDIDSLRKEIAILRDCKSPYIVRYFGCYLKKSTGELWLVLEYCNAGSVCDLMKST
jgi:serine/threonine protein kinase